MIRALTAIRNLTPAPPASEGLDADGLRIEMERIAGLTERWEDSLVSQVNTIARAALSAIRPTLDAERAAWEGEVADWLAVKHGDFSNEDSVAIRSGAYRQEQNDA